MDSAFIHQAANELVQNVGTRNIKQIARSCSLDISETSRIRDMLGLLSLYFDKPLILINHHLLCLFVQLAIDKNQWLIKIERKQTQHIFNAGCFTDVQTATAHDLFDVASSGILDKFVGGLVNKCRIHNVISFRGWHSEWNSGLQVHYSFLFSFLFSVLKIGFVHFIHDAVHILRGQLSAGK